MDNFIKKTAFGGYQKKSVETSIAGLEEQLEASRHEITHLKTENTAICESKTKLEQECNSLKEKIESKSNEIHRLKSRLNELHAQYENSLNTQREYDQYLNTVGQIYMVACNSAEGIVERSKNNADKFLHNLSESVEQTCTHTDDAIKAAKDTRNQLSASLPHLIETIHQTFGEIDRFLAAAQSVPQSYKQVQEMQKSSLTDMQKEILNFRKQTKDVVTKAQNANTTLQTNKTAHVENPKAPKAETIINDNKTLNQPTISIEEDKFEKKTTKKSKHLTLLEQQKQKMRNEITAESKIQQNQLEQKASTKPTSEISEFEETSISSKSKDTNMVEAQASSKTQLSPEMIPKSYKSHTNVKQLLNKYSKLK